MKKIMIFAFASVSLIAIAYVLWFQRAQSEGQEYVEPFIAAVSSLAECAWSGTARIRKTDETHVFVWCVAEVQLEFEAGNPGSLIKAVNEQIVTPGVAVIPDKQNASLIVIVPASENLVICSKVTEKTITRSWYDSYENYCLP